MGGGLDAACGNSVVWVVGALWLVGLLVRVRPRLEGRYSEFQFWAVGGYVSCCLPGRRIIERGRRMICLEFGGGAISQISIRWRNH